MTHLVMTLVAGFSPSVLKNISRQKLGISSPFGSGFKHLKSRPSSSLLTGHNQSSNLWTIKPPSPIFSASFESSTIQPRKGTIEDWTSHVTTAVAPVLVGVSTGVCRCWLRKPFEIILRNLPRGSSNRNPCDIPWNPGWSIGILILDFFIIPI